MAALPETTGLTAASPLNSSVNSLNWQHEAPDRPFAPEDAHRALQRHAGCGIDTCARKRAAHRVRVDAGYPVPDPRNSKNLG